MNETCEKRTACSSEGLSRTVSPNHKTTRILLLLVVFFKEFDLLRIDWFVSLKIEILNRSQFSLVQSRHIISGEKNAPFVLWNQSGKQAIDPDCQLQAVTLTRYFILCCSFSISLRKRVFVLRLPSLKSRRRSRGMLLPNREIQLQCGRCRDGRKNNPKPLDPKKW